MASSTLDTLTSMTSFTAHAYFLTGQTYHSQPSPDRRLRDELTVSSFRELPDLITVFGMLQERLLRARAAMFGGDEESMWKEMCVANQLIYEAWWKVAWLDRMVMNVDSGYLEQCSEDGEDDGEDFEKWRSALPMCCDAQVVTKETEQRDQWSCPVETWLDAVDTA